MIRNEAVAGQFYPGTKNSLLREIESLIDSRAARSDAVGVVSPHAGYAYSGSVAGSVLSHVSMRMTTTYWARTIRAWANRSA
jgi:AmmeMemoRadiSam system protein B